jgi:hypothetical protein
MKRTAPLLENKKEKDILERGRALFDFPRAFLFIKFDLHFVLVLRRAHDQGA